MQKITLQKRLRWFFGRLYFTIVFVGSITMTSILVKLLHLVPNYFVSLDRKQMLSSQISGLAFRLIVYLIPWLSIEYVPLSNSSSEPWSQLSKDSKPLVLINHTSTFDAFFYSAMVPLNIIKNIKTLAKSGVFSIPVLGSILHSCGHFPVHFTKQTTVGSFSVDKEKQAIVLQKMEAHINKGYGISMFPEGQINRGNTTELQSFRRGSFEIARRHNMPIWCFIHTGIDQFWPMNVRTVGGFPAKIRWSLFKVENLNEDLELNEWVSQLQTIIQEKLNILCLGLDLEEPLSSSL